MCISVIWSMLRYIASSKINDKPLTDTKYDFSIIVEKMENWIGRKVHAPIAMEYLWATSSHRLSIPCTSQSLKFHKNRHHIHPIWCSNHVWAIICHIKPILLLWWGGIGHVFVGREKAFNFEAHQILWNMARWRKRVMIACLQRTTRVTVRNRLSSKFVGFLFCFYFLLTFLY